MEIRRTGLNTRKCYKKVYPWFFLTDSPIEKSELKSVEKNQR